MPLYDGLTLKQKVFADEYIKTGNGTQSVLKAYDANANTARVIATENLAKPAVEAYIAKKIHARELTRDFVLTRLLDELDNEEANPVVRVKVLELLGKALRMFSEKQVDEGEVERIKSIAWGKIEKPKVIDDLSSRTTDIEIKPQKT